ncbi:MAG TPA: hypothetical protein VFZ05_02445 [Nitrososphaera sp.]
MQNQNRIPRWLVESDPSWEKSIDTNIGMLKWTKKGTGIQAVCSPTGMFCDILGGDDVQQGISDLSASVSQMKRKGDLAGDIAKYLSSRYLNPGINGPARFDLRRVRRF